MRAHCTLSPLAPSTLKEASDIMCDDSDWDLSPEEVEESKRFHAFLQRLKGVPSISPGSHLAIRSEPLAAVLPVFIPSDKQGLLAFEVSEKTLRLRQSTQGLTITATIPLSRIRTGRPLMFALPLRQVRDFVKANDEVAEYPFEFTRSARLLQYKTPSGNSYFNFTTLPTATVPLPTVRKDFGSTDPVLLSAAITFCHLYGRKSWRSGKDNVLNNFVDIVRGSAFGGHRMGICVVSSPKFQELSVRIPRSKLKAIAKVLRHFDPDDFRVQQTDSGYLLSDSKFTLHIDGVRYWDRPCGIPLSTHVPIDRVEIDRESFAQALRIALTAPGGGERIGRLALREEGEEFKLVIEHHHRGSRATTVTACVRDESFRDNPPHPWQIDVDLADLRRVIQFGPSSPVRLEMTNSGALVINRVWGEVTGRAYLAPLTGR